MSAVPYSSILVAVSSFPWRGVSDAEVSVCVRATREPCLPPGPHPLNLGIMTTPELFLLILHRPVLTPAALALGGLLLLPLL